jgi:uncharacterized Zn finger protein
MTIPTIDEDEIRSNATAASFERGLEYYHQENVLSLVQRGSLLQAAVQGSDWKPYQVTIDCTFEAIDSAHCTCPYDYDGWCKHIVATLLTVSRKPRQIEQGAGIEELLALLDEEKLRQLLPELVSEYPEIIDTIEQYVRRFATIPSKHTPVTDYGKITLNIASYRQETRNYLREALECAQSEYWEEALIPSGLHSLVGEALSYCDRSEGHNALAILEAITTTCIEEWDEIDEYGGNTEEIAPELEEAFTFVILNTELSPEERQDWQEKLSQWQDEWSVDFSMSLEALRQGWDHPSLIRALQSGNLPSDTQERLSSHSAHKLIEIRLTFLDDHDRDEEYLNFAKAEGRVIAYLTKLIYLDRLEEAIASSATMLTTVEEAYFVAKALRDQGAPEDALAIARRGFTLAADNHGHKLYELALWTCELAESLDDLDTALACGVKAFQESPSLEHYRKLQSLAGEDWPDLQLDLLDFLREFDHWHYKNEKIQIFLQEELIEDAIAAIPDVNSISRTLLDRVMEAAAVINPDWVIEKARPPAEKILDAKKSDSYQEAINWLKQVRNAYYQSGRSAEWKSYRSHLMKEHARKSKFMGLFKYSSLD